VNKSVPTLLGIVIILLVVLLVVVIYQYKLTQRLALGERVVGTIGGEALTGVETPKEDIGVSEVLGAREPEVETQRLSPKQIERSQERRSQRGDTREERQEQRKTEPGAGE
jgi:cell shape-determining protein MreC